MHRCFTLSIIKKQMALSTKSRVLYIAFMCIHLFLSPLTTRGSIGQMSTTSAGGRGFVDGSFSIKRRELGSFWMKLSTKMHNKEADDSFKRVGYSTQVHLYLPISLISHLIWSHVWRKKC